jgi:hypothetical protein
VCVHTGCLHACVVRFVLCIFLSVCVHVWGCVHLCACVCHILLCVAFDVVGVGGATCDDVLEDVEDLLAISKPARIVLVCGENDLAYGTSVGTTFERFQKVITAMVLYYMNKQQKLTRK